MLEVTGVSNGDAPFYAPIYNIYPDYVRVAQFIAEVDPVTGESVPGPTGDVRLCDLEFTCLGQGETVLAVTIEILANTNSEVIPATPVNGVITQQGVPGGGGGAGGGGGGGGDGDSEPTIEPEPGVTNVSDVISDEGEFTRTTTPTSEDGKVELTINKDTIGLVDGEPVSEIVITQIEPENLPVPPSDSNIIGLAYDFGPDGTNFVPPITLTFTYDLSLIPEGVAEEDLVIAVWNETTGEWVVLEGCTVDLDNHTISVPVGHFTTFAVVAYTRPAAFVASGLSIAPTYLDIGESVTINVLVTNTGDLEGTYQVILKMDDQQVETQDITLAGGASQRVTFTMAKDVAGSYLVDVDGLTGSFMVKPAAPVVPPTEPPAESPTTQPTAPPPEPASPSEVPPTKSIDWQLLGGIIAGVVVAVVVPVMLRRRRRVSS